MRTNLDRPTALKSFVAFGLGIFLTYTLITYQMAAWNQTQVARFEEAARDRRDAVLTRAHLEQLQLAGVAGFYLSNGLVNADNFGAYFAALQGSSRLAGLKELGFASSISRHHLDTWVQFVRMQGETGFEVYPSTLTENLMVVRFARTSDAEGARPGLNFADDPLISTTAQAAAASGATHLSPVLRRDTVYGNSGEALMMMPVYREGSAPETAAALKEALLGWSFARINIDRLISEVIASDSRSLEMTIYEGTGPDYANIIYTSDEAPYLDRPAPRFSRSEQIDMFGQPWFVVWSSRDSAVASFPLPTLLLLSVLGALASIAVAWVVASRENRARDIRDLVERQTRKLRERELENKAILGNAAVGILSIDSDGIVTFCNGRAAEILGGTEQSIVGERLAARMPTLEPSVAVQSLEYHREDEGTPRFLQVFIRQWDTGTAPARSTVILQDDTESHKAVGDLRDNEQRWNTALAGGLIGVYDVDLTTGKSKVSDTWRTLMGLGEVEAGFDLQAYFMSHIVPEDLPLLRAADEACFRHEVDRSQVEIRVNVPGRGMRWMRCDGAVVSWSLDGKPLRMVGTQVDVTAIKFAQSALRASEDRFRTMFLASPIGMILLNDKMRTEAVNPAMNEMLGLEANGMSLGLPIQDLIGDDIWELIHQELTRARKRNSAPVLIKGEVLRRGGTKCWVMLSASEHNDPVTDQKACVVQVLDMTEIARVEAMKHQFIATVSHELRTPLTSIKGAVSLLGSMIAKSGDAQSKRLMDIAERNVDRLKLLVNDILDFEKSQSSQVPLSIDKVPVKNIVDASVTQVTGIAAKARVSLVIENQVDGARVSADFARACQCVENFLANAIRYSTAEDSVRVVARNKNGHVRIEVRDQGPGVPDYFVDRLFKPFSQADSTDTRTHGGTGLGLAISKEFANRMKGDVGHLRDGKETVFWIDLKAIPAN